MRKMVLATLGLVAVTALAWAQTPPTKPDEMTLSDAYLLGRALVIRQEHMDRRSDDFSYNTIKYNPLGPPISSTPNSTSPISGPGCQAIPPLCDLILARTRSA